jgi:hypothetical protein
VASTSPPTLEVAPMNGRNVKIGDWYLDRDQHDFLLVIGVDEEEGFIDVRDESTKSISASGR